MLCNVVLLFLSAVDEIQIFRPAGEPSRIHRLQPVVKLVLDDRLLEVDDQDFQPSQLAISEM